MFEAVVPLGDRYSFLHREPLADGEVAEGSRAQLDWVAALVSDLKAEGEVAPDVPSARVVGQIDQLVWTGWDQVARGRVAAADAASLCVRTLLEGPDRNVWRRVGRHAVWYSTERDGPPQASSVLTEQMVDGAGGRRLPGHEPAAYPGVV